MGRESKKERKEEKRVKTEEGQGNTNTQKKFFHASEAVKILEMIEKQHYHILGIDPSRGEIKNSKVCRIWRETSELYNTIFACGSSPSEVRGRKECDKGKRPSVKASSTMRSQDDLTHQYMNIVMVNNEISNKKANRITDTQLEESIERLQFLVTTLFNNDLSSKKERKVGKGKKT